jgi:hypothetical protein
MPQVRRRGTAHFPGLAGLVSARSMQQALYVPVMAFVAAAQSGCVHHDRRNMAGSGQTKALALRPGASGLYTTVKSIVRRMISFGSNMMKESTSAIPSI